MSLERVLIGLLVLAVAGLGLFELNASTSIETLRTEIAQLQSMQSDQAEVLDAANIGIAEGGAQRAAIEQSITALGSTATPQEVAEAILAEDGDAFMVELSNLLAERYDDRALFNPPLIAAVAEAVVDQFGDDLRPSAASAVEIAAALEISPTFASLVADYAAGQASGE
ncbi:hypothetical protein [Parasedimentitalea psychrophila]|uniref:Uncharacterized protein n=1 Tax=Parasedimentitalea psychrophila TaxID=2997337 RepID=A0A9Y2KWP6_9RHOB|nr:hypothetical protein [Parasedimentitalea psychrophila]WIY24530.1 hypothetical protein QPJ95_18605 [Parasedimentitalea psychrophila]